MKHTFVQVSTLELQLPGAVGRTLSTLQLPFEVHLDPVHMEDLIQEFHGVIAQDGELVHRGNFVQLSAPYQMVS